MLVFVLWWNHYKSACFLIWHGILLIWHWPYIGCIPFMLPSLITIAGNHWVLFTQKKMQTKKITIWWCAVKILGAADSSVGYTSEWFSIKENSMDICVLLPIREKEDITWTRESRILSSLCYLNTFTRKAHQFTIEVGYLPCNCWFWRKTDVHCWI